MEAAGEASAGESAEVTEERRRYLRSFADASEAPDPGKENLFGVQLEDPKPATERQRGSGAPCPHCESVDTAIRKTVKPRGSAYPAWLEARRRYHVCYSCGREWRTGP